MCIYMRKGMKNNGVILLCIVENSIDIKESDSNMFNPILEKEVHGQKQIMR